jgi:hypothetical protein
MKTCFRWRHFSELVGTGIKGRQEKAKLENELRHCGVQSSNKVVKNLGSTELQIYDIKIDRQFRSRGRIVQRMEVLLSLMKYGVVTGYAELTVLLNEWNETWRIEVAPVQVSSLVGNLQKGPAILGAIGETNKIAFRNPRGTFCGAHMNSLGYISTGRARQLPEYRRPIDASYAQYEQRKAAWRAVNPNATNSEQDQAMQRIARECEV